MRKIISAASAFVMAAGVFAGTMVAPKPAEARDRVSVGIGTPGVSFYYDSQGHRHRRYHSRVRGWRNTYRYNNRWRDSDRDGIPNRRDDHPFNPNRR
jgi:hypothetical protein